MLFLLLPALMMWGCEQLGLGEGPGPRDDNGQGGDNGGNNTPEVVVDWTDEAWYATNFWERTDRQKEGLRGPVKKLCETTYVGRTDYEYDRQGHLIKTREYNSDGTGQEKICTYAYDASGRLVKMEVRYAGDDTLYAVETYEYNNPGRFVATNLFDCGMEVTGLNNAIIKDCSYYERKVYGAGEYNYWTATYTFGDDGNLTVKESNYSKGESDDEPRDPSESSFTIRYQNGMPVSSEGDNRRYKVQEVSYYPNGMYRYYKLAEQNSYNFDTGWDVKAWTMLDNGRYLAIKEFDLLEGQPSSISLTSRWYSRLYDEHFDLTENKEGNEERGTADPVFDDTWTDYKYDAHGNWISRDEHGIARWTGQKYTTTHTRVIEYFE